MQLKQQDVVEIVDYDPLKNVMMVIGTKDPILGEVGKAFIVLKPGKKLSSDELMAYLQGNLAKYKIPKQYEFRDDLPKSAAGKILKRELVD